MKKGIVFIAFLFALVPMLSALQLSPSSKVSVLTCSPGAELYSTFGHTAIRVHDPARNIDWVYNYGTFEFSDDFYLLFAQGKLDYALSKTDLTNFTNEYIYFGRQVLEQELIIELQDRQALLDALEKNYLPENRYYRYDFFFDNCCTRVRDMLKEVLGDELVFPNPIAPESMTFREMIESYQGHIPWGDFGIDLALGVPCDRYMEAEEDMFIPDYLMQHLGEAQFQGKTLCAQPKELVPLMVNNLENKAFDWPYLLAILLMIASFVWAFRATTRTKERLWFDRVLLVFFGLIGVAVFLLWFATDHTITKINLNLVWASPLHLLALFLLSKTWIKHYFAFCSIVLFVFLCSEWWWPMDFHHSFWALGAANFVLCIRLATLPAYWGTRA
ncbi:MAG: DUF4105 domain-containing protein [Bacteroidetes bacterium]|nr:DUF4105 domain-containing protein [Bacteroidota bacterium]